MITGKLSDSSTRQQVVHKGHLKGQFFCLDLTLDVADANTERLISGVKNPIGLYMWKYGNTR